MRESVHKLDDQRQAIERLMQPGVDVDSVELLHPRPRWMRDGSCVEHPFLSWFDAGHTTQAIEICRGCIVVAECLAHALEHDEPAGVWGGLSPAERRALRESR